MVAFSFPLGRIYGTEGCKVVMTSGVTSGVTGGRGESPSSSSSSNSSGSGSGSNSSSDSSGSSSSGSNMENGSGSGSVVQLTMTVKDIIASPETSGCPVDNDCNDLHPTHNNNGSSSGSHDDLHNNNNPLYTGTKKDPALAHTHPPAVRCRWHTSYTGATFGLRHSFSATVKRAWYAWSPELTVPICLYRLTQPLVGGVDGTAPPRICGRHEDAEDEEENNLLPLRVRVGGWHSTGLCVMTVPSRWVDMDAPLLGKVSGAGGNGA